MSYRGAMQNLGVELLFEKEKYSGLLFLCKLYDLIYIYIYNIYCTCVFPGKNGLSGGENKMMTIIGLCCNI